MDPALAGGKGASLGKLIGAGFPVPGGFVVSTYAYAAFLAANDLQPYINGILDGLDCGNLEQVERKTARIRDRIAAGDFPEPLADAIRDAYRALGHNLFVAVVSGLVNPDDYILDAKTGMPKARRLGDKALTIRRSDPPEGGTVKEPTDPALRQRLTLTDRQLKELAALGVSVTSYYEGVPQDVERALSGGRFHLLQCRPVTGVDFL